MIALEARKSGGEFFHQISRDTARMNFVASAITSQEAPFRFLFAQYEKSSLSGELELYPTIPVTILGNPFRLAGRVPAETFSKLPNQSLEITLVR